MARTIGNWLNAGRRGVALGAVLVVAGAVAYGSAAAAAGAPQPSLSQVKAEVNGLTARLDALGQRYDQVAQQLPVARARLTQVEQQVTADQAQFQAARAQMVQLAEAAYEDGNQESAAALLTSGNPDEILKQSSLLLQLAGTRNAETQQLLTAAQQLDGVRLSLQRTEYSIATLRTQLAAQKTSMTKLLASKQATLDSLTAQQQDAVAASTVGGAAGNTDATGATGATSGTGSGTASGTGSGTASGGTNTYTGPTSTQAEKAVAFAYAQIGKPYQWGATGPYSYDCSGLVQAAWAYAGVAIPRDTYSQWAALPHIPSTDLQPGDLMYFDGVGHVAMYVGGGYMIDAPQTGETVRKLPVDTGWYTATFVGAARP
ncbi:MAG: C40 family peptidase [Streptosporangiaceae bacterium]|nr:C40 family peptidase [Streptosporangiaceae bacterium]